MRVVDRPRYPRHVTAAREASPAAPGPAHHELTFADSNSSSSTCRGHLVAVAVREPGMGAGPPPGRDCALAADGLDESTYRRRHGWRPPSVLFAQCFSVIAPTISAQTLRPRSRPAPRRVVDRRCAHAANRRRALQHKSDLRTEPEKHPA